MTFREGQTSIDASQVTKSIKDKFKHLDTETPDSARGLLSRKKRNLWPELEAGLWEFQQRCQHAKVPITGETLKQYAQRLRPMMECYQGKPAQAFSNVWFGGLRERHKIRAFTYHGEAGGVDEKQAEAHMLQIRAEVRKYQLRDVCNADQTGLFWKQSPQTTLATERTAGCKHDKSRIRVIICATRTGAINSNSKLSGTPRDQ